MKIELVEQEKRTINDGMTCARLKMGELVGDWLAKPENKGRGLLLRPIIVTSDLKWVTYLRRADVINDNEAVLRQNAIVFSYTWEILR